MFEKGSMKKNFSPALSYYCSLLLCSLAANASAACGTGTGTNTVTPLPSLGGSSLSAYGLNAAGQIAGDSYTAGDVTDHAFIYSGGLSTDLGTLVGGTYSIGYALNNVGQVSGEADVADGSTHTFLSGATNLLDLGTLGGTWSSPTAMNDAGQVVGSSTLAGDVVTMAFLYVNGTLTNLGTLGGGDYSIANGINNSGTVVGEASTTNGHDHAFAYANGTMKDLGDLGGGSSSAADINAAGVIVGQSSTTNGSTHGFVYANGVMTDVGTIGGTYSTAYLINSNGQVAGLGYTLNNAQTHGFFYNGTITDLGDLGGGYSAAKAINNQGVVVGLSKTAGGIYHAFIYQNGQMTDLNTLLPPNSGWTLSSAEFINDSGRIVGYGIYSGAFEWFILDLASSTSNSTPVAVAGPNQTVDCAGQVTLDGSQSGDPDNDPLAYEWSVGVTVLGTNVTIVTSLPEGTNVVTLKVTDPCGNSDQANVIIVVADTSAPQILSTPAPITISSDAGCQAVVPNVLSNVVAVDNCSPANQLVLAQSPVAGTIVGPGQYTITVTVADAASNTSSNSVSLTVVDTMAPTIISTPAPLTLSAGPNGQVAVPNVLSGVAASDNCTASNQLVMTQSPVAGTPVGPGQYTITINVADAASNSSTASVSLTVADTTPPTIASVPAPLTISSDASCQATVPNVLSNVVAVDNCTPANQLVLAQSPAAGTIVGSGNYTITVTVTDAAGNPATGSVSLAVVDTTAPTILSVPAPISVRANANCQGIVPNVLTNVVASDNCTPANQLVMTQIPAAGTVVGTGAHPITVLVADAAGNTSTATVSFNVSDTVAPVISSHIQPITVSANANGQGVVPNVLSQVVATDNCTPANQLVMTQNPAAGTILGSGHYKITITVTDLSGNSATDSVNLKIK